MDIRGACSKEFPQFWAVSLNDGERERESQKEREKGKERGKDSETERGKGRGKERGKERGQERGKERERERGVERDEGKSQSLPALIFPGVLNCFFCVYSGLGDLIEKGSRKAL